MDFIRRYVLHNIGLKLISLLAATLLWMAIAREPMEEVTLSVPIEFQNAPTNLEISAEVLPQVQVRVSGPSTRTHALRPAEVHAVIDLVGAKPGERTYDLSASRVRVPREMQVVQVIPSQFRISFDNRATRRVPVKPRVVGSSAPGFTLQEVLPDPDSVTIVGPEKHVAEVESVITDPVDASGVIGKATFTTHVYISDPLVRLASPSTVHVTVATERVR